MFVLLKMMALPSKRVSKGKSKRKTVFVLDEDYDIAVETRAQRKK